MKTLHTPKTCKRDVINTQYVGKGYKSKFTCPECGSSCWQHLSFLGRRDVVCDGAKFTKVEKTR
jgi:hypothetical protein